MARGHVKEKVYYNRGNMYLTYYLPCKEHTSCLYEEPQMTGVD